MIFNSYVKLPEGKICHPERKQKGAVHHSPWWHRYGYVWHVPETFSHHPKNVREYTVGTDTYYLQDFISGLGLNCHLTTQSHKTQNKFLRIKIPQSCHQPLKFWNFAFTSYRRYYGACQNPGFLQPRFQVFMIHPQNYPLIFPYISFKAQNVN